MATSVHAPNESLKSSKLKFKDNKLLGLLGSMLSSMLVIFLVLNYWKILNKNKQIYIHRSCSPEDHFSTTICTEGCRIPLLTLDRDSNQSLLQDYGVLDELQPCRAIPLLGSNRTHIWVKKENMHHFNLRNSNEFTCCYKSFYRYTVRKYIFSFDHRIKYSDCQNFTDALKVDSEFVRVTCTNTCNNTKLFDSFFVFAREKAPTSKSLQLPYNILILGIDSVSRLNFHRTMPKTERFLKRLDAVQLIGYNKVGDNTFPNLVPLLMGKADTEVTDTPFSCALWNFDHCPFIWKQYKQAGFVTAFAEDVFNFGTFNYKKPGFKFSPTDYFLDPFISEAETIAHNKRLSATMLCMNEKYFFKLFLDYVEDLTMLKSKLFGCFWESTMSHDNLFFPTVMDDSYSNFFSRLYSSGYLNRSIIFVMSDHGIRFGRFRRSKQGFYEERLPFVFALMPPSFRENYDEAYKNLKLNRHRLTTPFDMHATLTDLVNLDNIKNDKIMSRSKKYHFTRGISLFLPISEQRTCQSAGIDDHWCTCYRHRKLQIDNIEGKKAIKHVISHLKRLLKKHPQCAKLAHVKTLGVSQLLSEHVKKDSIELIVTFQANPGNGIFEATVARKGKNGPWSVVGSVSRLNLYGNQSYCVSDPRLALYCFCIIGIDSAFKESKYVNFSKNTVV